MTETERLAELIDTVLTPNERAVVLLVASGFGLRKAAKTLGVSRTTAKDRYERALRKLAGHTGA